MYTLLYLFFGVIPIVFTQCPDVKPVNNFNMTAFEGKSWYEFARYNDDFEGSEDCTILSFKEENGVVLFNVRSTLNKEIRNFGGSVDVKANKDGIMYYHLKAFADMAWILSTTKSLSPAAKEAIENLFQSSKIIDKSKFFWENFHKCCLQRRRLGIYFS